MNKILFVLLSLLISLQSYSQEQNEKEVSFLLLGDIHYDLLEDHDMEWLSTKPDDLRQVTKEYSVFTKNTWYGILPDNQRASSKTPAVNKSRSANGGLVRRIGRFSTKSNTDG
ncbi:hypothetical protein NXV81_16075 [Bacteroides ovatus]|nr:hypothetical protein [Bacteroides ovatus]